MTLRNDTARAEALRAYGRLLGLSEADLEDPALIDEAVALTDALAVAAERDLGDAPPARLDVPADRE